MKPKIVCIFFNNLEWLLIINEIQTTIRVSVETSSLQRDRVQLLLFDRLKIIYITQY